jgi:uncharacterized phage protein gp47/JayE
MFEAMSYESIMAEMMEDMPDGVDTSEGSLIFNACAKIAVRIAEWASYWEPIEKNMYIDTADFEHLIRWGNDRGIAVNYATFAEFKAQFNLAVEIGERFNAGVYNYTVLDVLDEEKHIYRVVCDTAGKDANEIFADLIPIDYIEGFEEGHILECTKQGTDMENMEAYRERLRVSLYNQGSGGNREWYTSKIKQYAGVGGVKLARVKTPQDVIHATVISSAFARPAADFIDGLQSYLDPVVNSGEGYGLAPIGHRVTVSAVDETTVNITTNITYEDGVEYADVGTQINQAIEAYLLSLRKTWEVSGAITVRIVQIEAALVAIQGIVDVAGTQINGSESNLILAGTIPIKGEITCT